jgi:hypothetical protein
MAIENRDLAVGTRLTATYKKQNYVCTVEAGEGGRGRRLRPGRRQAL